MGSAVYGRRLEGRLSVVTRRLTEADGRRAEALWAEYQTKHDVSDRIGQTVGIDPETGALWFGESIIDVVDQRDAAGVHKPLHFIRVGSKAYYRKGGRG
jgi:hypothetical protein